MKVGDLVRVKPEHQRGLAAAAVRNGEEPLPILGIITWRPHPRSNGDYILLHNRPTPAHVDYFEVISASR